LPLANRPLTDYDHADRLAKEPPVPATNPAPQPKPPRPATRLLLIAADLYAASAAVYLLLRLLTGDRFWPVRLADTLASCCWL